MPSADPWNTETVETFERFVDVVKPLMPSISTESHLYWFRGQRDEKWPLHSSFSRMLSGSSLPLEEVTGLEEFALGEFRSKAHFFVIPALLAKVRTTPCWWALMQHHGAPTRLLDWSTSPYVAAYFAVNQYMSKENGALWCFCSTTLHDAFIDKYRAHPPAFEDDGAPRWYSEKLDELRETQMLYFLRPLIVRPVSGSWRNRASSP
jgi:FRG domain